MQQFWTQRRSQWDNRRNRYSRPHLEHLLKRLLYVPLLHNSQLLQTNTQQIHRGEYYQGQCIFYLQLYLMLPSDCFQNGKFAFLSFNRSATLGKVFLFKRGKIFFRKRCSISSISFTKAATVFLRIISSS